jgi:hypothetical protein
MDEASQSPFAGPAEMVAAAQVARRYYFDNRSKVQIARELGMTRSRVARLLERARTSGIVRISVIGAGSLDLVLSERSGTADRVGDIDAEQAGGGGGPQPAL